MGRMKDLWMDEIEQARYDNLITALHIIEELIDGIEGTEEACDIAYLYPNDLIRAKNFLEEIH